MESILNQTLMDLNVLFVLRKSRLNSQGKCPINCRIKINGEIATDFSTKLLVSPGKWDSKAQKAKSDPVTNAELTRISNDLMNIYIQERSKGIQPTAEHIRQIYIGEKSPVLDFPRLIEMKLDELRTKKRSKATLIAYTRHYNRFVKYVRLPVSGILKKHVQAFHRHLLKSGYALDYANKSIQALYGLFRIAVDEDILRKNPASGLNLDWKKETDTTHLTAEELQVLISTDWSPVLQRVVDAFLFMCYSGMHVSDYMKFSTDNIHQVEGRSVIYYYRQKNDQPAIVPMNPVLASLLLKYGSPEQLPRMAAQRMNMYLKIIAEKAGIEKVMTNKIARKTFTDMSLNTRKMTFEAVATMLGHADTKWIKAYGNIRASRILSEWRD